MSWSACRCHCPRSLPAAQERSRLHFVRGSRVEAARVAEEAKNHFETGRCSDSDGFSARHSSREYGYYEQFRGFRRSVDLNGAVSNYLRLVLLVLTYFLHFPTPEYVNMIKRLCRKLLYMYSSTRSCCCLAGAASMRAAACPSVHGECSVRRQIMLPMGDCTAACSFGACAVGWLFSLT